MNQKCDVKSKLLLNFRELYESSCNCLKNSIVNRIVDYLLIIGTDKLLLEEKDILHFDTFNVCGVEIKDNFIHLIFSIDNQFVSCRIYNEQKDDNFVKFDSDINNWINFIEKIQNSIKPILT